MAADRSGRLDHPQRRRAARCSTSIRVGALPLFAVHGDRDIVVPLRTGRDAARRADGELVVVDGATHSWLLKDPEAMPAIVHELMRGRLGTAVLRAKGRAGLDADASARARSTPAGASTSRGQPGGGAHAPAGRGTTTRPSTAPPRYRWHRSTLERLTGTLIGGDRPGRGLLLCGVRFRRRPPEREVVAPGGRAPGPTG